MKKAIILLSLLLAGCGGMDFTNLLVTVTPTHTVGVTAVPEPTPTTLPTITPMGIPTPTPICVDVGCLQVTPGATPLGQDRWEYIISGYWQIECISDTGCKVRQQPSLEDYAEDGSPLFVVVPRGTRYDASAIYHCEKWADCPAIANWYQLKTGEWAANADGVWQDITGQ